MFTTVIGSALAVPAGAQAHHTAVPVVALDYRNRILTVAGGRGGVRATLENAGRRLRVTVDRSLQVVVLGLSSEPLLRFSPSGVAVNRRSLSAVSLKLVSSDQFEPARGGASWLPLSRRHSFAWADSRVATPPTAAGASSNWIVPIMVDGTPGKIAGHFTREARPAVWPWILLALVPVIAGAAALGRRRFALPAAIGLAAAAAVATLATLAGFAGSGLQVSSDRWLLFALEVALVVSAAALVGRRRFRLGALSVLAPFAVLQALSDLAVFRHGVVVSALPDWIVRGAVSISLGCGLALGLLAYRGLEPVGASRRVGNPRTAGARRRRT